MLPKSKFASGASVKQGRQLLSGLNFFHDCTDTTDKKTFATDEHRFSQISEKKESLAFLYLCSSVLICGEKFSESQEVANLAGAGR